MDVELKSALDGIVQTVSGYDARIKPVQAQADAIDLQNKGRFVEAAR